MSDSFESAADQSGFTIGRDDLQDQQGEAFSPSYLDDGSSAFELREDASVRAGRLGKMVTAAEVVSVAALMSPLNEIVRLGAVAAVYKVTKDPVLSGGITMAGSTFAVETAATVLTADLMSKPSSKRLVDRVNGWLEKRKMSDVAKTNVVSEAAISYLTGNATLIFLKHRQDPERTRSENIRYGTKFSLGTAAVLGVQGYLTTRGIAVPGKETIAEATGVVGSVIFGAMWAKRKFIGRADALDEEQQSMMGTESDD